MRNFLSNPIHLIIFTQLLLALALLNLKQTILNQGCYPIFEPIPEITI
jgi:hypothetical protein